jgi:hypothetical protein
MVIPVNSVHNLPNSPLDHDALTTACGQRTADLALAVATQTGHPEYSLLSSAMCWDAMLLCAGIAQGVNCADLQPYCDSRRIGFNIINRHNRRRVFDEASTQDITSVAQMLNTVTPGSFIGFIRPNDEIGHAMIYIGNGFAAGNKNDCVFSAGSMFGWERLDLRDFFGVDAARNPGTGMVARPVEGQVF